jgi:hypothetical protein
LETKSQGSVHFETTHGAREKVLLKNQSKNVTFSVWKCIRASLFSAGKISTLGHFQKDYSLLQEFFGLNSRGSVNDVCFEDGEATSLQVLWKGDKVNHLKKVGGIEKSVSENKNNSNPEDN